MQTPTTVATAAAAIHYPAAAGTKTSSISVQLRIYMLAALLMLIRTYQTNTQTYLYSNLF